LRSILSIFLALAVAGFFSCAAPQKIVRQPGRAKKVYIVKRGDTLAGISRKFGVTVSALKKRNGLSSSNIVPGQRIVVSTGRGSGGGSAVAARSSDGSSQSPKKYKKPKTYSKKKRKRKGRKGRFVAPTKAPRIKVRLSWPIDKPVVTSRFGVRKSGKHDGIDIGAPKGTKIHASAAGQVLFSGWGPTGYGLLVLIKHSEKVYTVYAHNQKNRVKKGARVKRGQVIAKVGKSGRATGNHLHFEVRVNRVAYDPLAYLSKLNHRRARK